MHQEYVGYPLWDIPYLHCPVVTLLVGPQIPCVAVNLDPTIHGPYVLQVLLALEIRHR